MDATLPPRAGVALAGGADAVTEATTEDLLAFLEVHRVPPARLREVAQLDRGLRGFQRTVLRYGLVKALIDKGHEVARDEAAWSAFDAAMRARLGQP